MAERYLMGPLVEVFARAARDGELRPGVAPHVAAMALIGLSGSLSAGPLHAAPLDDAVRTAADLLLNGVAAR